jgi:hypothetical protein
MEKRLQSKEIRVGKVQIAVIEEYNVLTKHGVAKNIYIWSGSSGARSIPSLPVPGCR